MPASPAPGRDVPGVITLPPFIYLGFLALGIALQLVWPAALVSTSFPLRVGIAVSLGLLGIALGVSGVDRFRRAGTARRPTRPATALVVDGPYRFTRNPMYLGMTLLYAGIALGANSPWILGLLVPLLIVLHYGVIFREEAYLERKFGDAYRKYKATVRRWL
jgi:protein-S-isoprenylcysteine O-methyltransferase Ste14